jgi:REP element-mobilizing transposase RayT
MRLLRQVAAAAGIDMIKVEAAVDHLHLLLRLEDQHELSSVVHRLKGASSHLLFVKFPDLRWDMAGALWQKGYGSRLIPPRELETVKTYTLTQDEEKNR